MSRKAVKLNALDLPKCVRCACDLIDDFQLIFDDAGLELELQKLLGICFDIDVKIRLNEIQALCEDCLNELIDTYDIIQRNEESGKPSSSNSELKDIKAEVESVSDSSDCEQISDDELHRIGEGGECSFFDKSQSSTGDELSNQSDLGSTKYGQQGTCAGTNDREYDEITGDSNEVDDDGQEISDPNKSNEGDTADTGECYNKGLPMKLDPDDSNVEGNIGDDEFPHVDYLDEFDEEIDFKEYKSRVLQSKFLDVCFPEGIKCRLCSETVENHVSVVKHTVEQHCVEDFAYPCIIDNECKSFSSEEELTLHLVFKHYDLDALVIYCKCPECDKRFNDFPSFNKHSCYQKADASKKRIDCEQCGKTFISNKRYRFHLQFHLEKRRPKACFICDKLFRDQDEFFEHVMYSHDKINGHLCLRCDRVFSAASIYKQHLNIHKSKRPYACILCSKSYIYKHYLNDHMISSHGAESPYKCHICGQFFVSETVLNNHLLAHNKPKPTEVICCNTCGFVAEDEKEAESHLEGHGNEDVHTITEIIDRAYVCEYCELAYNSIENLNQHRNSHIKKAYYCCECSESFEEYKDFRSHKFSHPNYPDKRKTFPVTRHYACDLPECSKSYLQRIGLKAHKKHHHLKRTLKCPKCRENFDTTEEFENHMIKIHNGFDYNCQFCEKTYSTKLALSVHISRKHCTNQYKCDSCDYGYPTKEQLNRHKYSVHQELPCEICGAVLKNFRNYQLHLRIVHEKEKRFFCKYCNKGFFKNCDVLSHEQAVHLKVKRYKCELCSYQAVYKAAFTIHMRAHRNENPFVCNICGRSFRKNYSLKVHIKRHNNIRDHKCPYEGCEYAYAEKTNLTLHIRLKHGEGGSLNSKYAKKTNITRTRSFFNVPKSDVFIDDDDGLDFGSDEEQPKAKMARENYTDESNTDEPSETVFRNNDSSPAVVVKKNYSDHDYILHDGKVDAYGDVIEDYEVAEVEVESNSIDE